jgi:cysteine desulfurase/selenocysteine lyase
MPLRRRIAAKLQRLVRGGEDVCCSVEIPTEDGAIGALRARGEVHLPVRILAPPKQRAMRKLREDFPILQRQVNGRPAVYLDNACMALRPEPVIRAIEGYYREYSGCHGRAQHAFGTATTAAFDDARRTVRDFLGAADAAEILFTRNTTEAINLVARGLDWQPGDAVLSSDLEHNSNLLPWQDLANRAGVEHRIVPTRPDTRFDMAAFRRRLDRKVKLVSVLHSSNLTGVCFPLAEIVREAHAAGALVLVDAAQGSLGHNIDVRKLGVDLLAFSGHKALGPTGTGVLYARRDVQDRLSSMLLGGETVTDTTYTDRTLGPAPYRYEAGLQNYAGIIGLGAALSYIQGVGQARIAKRVRELNTIATEQLGKLERVEILGPADPALRGGLFTFRLRGIAASDVAWLLSTGANIMTRAGKHCVHAWYNGRGEEPAVRASFAFYNSPEEVDFFCWTVKDILRSYRG